MCMLHNVLPMLQMLHFFPNGFTKLAPLTGKPELRKYYFGDVYKEGFKFLVGRHINEAFDVCQEGILLCILSCLRIQLRM